MRSRALVGLALALTLAACGGRPDRPRSAGTGSPHRPSERRPVSDMPVKIGSPYQVNGVWYVPKDEPAYDEVGLASWYGPSFDGVATANGEIYAMDGVSAAHKTLPLPSYVEVTALASGQTIVLRINDRGPFVGDRVIDLSRGAARALGIEKAGVARVRVRRVEPPEADRLALRSGRPASARPVLDGAALARLAARFDRQPVVLAAAAPAPPPAAPGPPPSAAPATPRMASVEAAIAQALASPDAPRISGYYVQVASIADAARAGRLASEMAGQGTAQVVPAGALWRVRLGPYGDQQSALAMLARIKARGYADARLLRDGATP